MHMSAFGGKADMTICAHRGVKTKESAPICASLKIDPYDARVKLRSARSDAKQYPHLSKHKAGHAWAWPPAIKEVKAALKNGDAS
jgi:hypothetical protein